MQDVSTGASTSISSPPKKGSKPSPKSTLMERQTQIIRTFVHNFYLTEQRRPMLKGIFNKLKENDISFQGGLSTLSKVVKRIGFKWKRSTDKRQILVESYDIRAKRIKYLQQLQSYMRGADRLFLQRNPIFIAHILRLKTGPMILFWDKRILSERSAFNNGSHRWKRRFYTKRIIDFSIRNKIR
ncbi:hypothetical protein QE152_g8648 [Popillia japonica]|uniref:Uncharacterized protein n=1 Tax=Popillia japonica TaxID=7064 RepID=A0AAW1M3M3_POPJA